MMRKEMWYWKGYFNAVSGLHIALRARVGRLLSILLSVL